MRRGTHEIREPTIRPRVPAAVRPCMSSEVEVLEGSVSKKAVFSGQVGGNDVRVVREVSRPDQVGKGLA